MHMEFYLTFEKETPVLTRNLYFHQCKGPLLVRLPNKRWVAVGIVSWGVRCGEKNRPGIYTRVSSYSDWIVENAIFWMLCQFCALRVKFHFLCNQLSSEIDLKRFHFYGANKFQFEMIERRANKKQIPKRNSSNQNRNFSFSFRNQFILTRTTPSLFSIRLLSFALRNSLSSHFQFQKLNQYQSRFKCKADWTTLKTSENQ